MTSLLLSKHLFISGKDSLYNESPLGPVTPTLLITALGFIPDVRLTTSMDVKAPGNLLYIFGQTFRELGGSEYYKLKGHMGKTVPKVRAAQAKRNFKAVTQAIDLGFVKACHDLSEGGLAVTAAEMALAGGYGMELNLKKVPSEALNRNDFLLFSESNSRFLIEVPEKAKNEFEAVMKGRVCTEIGWVTKNSKLTIHGLDGTVVVDTSLTNLRRSWKETLSSGV